MRKRLEQKSPKLEAILLHPGLAPFVSPELFNLDTDKPEGTGLAPGAGDPLQLILDAWKRFGTPGKL